MAATFLSKLGLTDDERKKLSSIGASTPAMLLGVYKASTESFEQLFGAQRAKEVVSRLLELLTPEERERATKEAPRFHMGARLERPPSTIPKPPYSLEERDRLLDEIQKIKSESPAAADQVARLSTLEQRLKQLLERK